MDTVHDVKYYVAFRLNITNVDKSPPSYHIRVQYTSVGIRWGAVACPTYQSIHIKPKNKSLKLYWISQSTIILSVWCMYVYSICKY